MPLMLNVKSPNIPAFEGGVIIWVNGYRKLMEKIMQFMTLAINKVSDKIQAVAAFIHYNSLVPTVYEIIYKNSALLLTLILHPSCM